MTKTNAGGVYSGNRYIYSSEGSPTFERDADKLFVQYENLRKNAFYKYKDRFSDNATQQELKSYIDEQFITLVKEYDINSKVDFPGYIKTKLYARVSQSFVRSRHKDNSREMLEGKDYQIQEMLEGQGTHLDYSTELLLEDIFAKVSLSDMENTIIDLWLEQQVDIVIKEAIQDTYKVTPKEVDTTMEELRGYIKDNLPET